MARAASMYPDDRAEKGCVIFLLDRGFLPALKVCVYTFRNALAQSGLDVVIMTNDKGVAEDPFILKISNRTLLLTDADIQRLHSVRFDAVEKHMHTPQIGKFTFLKFLCFDDIGYDFHIFLDCDLLCVDPHFRFDEIIGDCEFSAVPTFTVGFLRFLREHRQPINFKRLHNDLSDKDRVAVREHVVQQSEQQFSIKHRFNSGVWFARRPLLGRGTADGLINHASAKAFRFDDFAMHSYMCEVAKPRFQALPFWYNLTTRPCLAMGEKEFNNIRDRVKIVHPCMIGKPWRMRPGTGNWLQRMWWSVAAEAKEWIDSH